MAARRARAELAVSAAMHRHAILLVPFGRLRGTKLVLRPRTRITIGRTDRADLVLAHDPVVSGLHAEIAWDGRHAFFRDLGSQSGTLLDGLRAPGGRLHHGSWLQIGQTPFCLYHEAHTPARHEPSGATEAVAARRSAREGLRAEPTLYAVLDAARSERIPVLLRESIDDARSLYEGAKGDALAQVAPHLVRFQEPSGLLDRVIEEGWGDSWGIYFATGASPREVRRHLRRFLMVAVEDAAEPRYFRYYDPRVWRSLLPLVTVLQRSELFGPMDRFFAEGPAGELLRFERDGSIGPLAPSSTASSSVAQSSAPRPA